MDCEETDREMMIDSIKSILCGGIVVVSVVMLILTLHEEIHLANASLSETVTFSVLCRLQLQTPNTRRCCGYSDAILTVHRALTVFCNVPIGRLQGFKQGGAVAYSGSPDSHRETTVTH